MKKLSKGQIAGILGGLATIATSLGFAKYAVILDDPTTAVLVTALVGVISSLVAGHLPGASAAVESPAMEHAAGDKPGGR